MLLQLQPVSANASELVVAQDYQGTYSRSAFKHWIDEDRNGCNTRAEVLIAEAVMKPKVGKKCVLTGGRWLSAYDGKTTAKASDLDVDHMVPLAEAWRSGAWAWTPAQRQQFANDLSDPRALIAVSLSQNRSKGDKDPSKWLPKIDQCNYISHWIAIKTRYSLSVDNTEAATLDRYVVSCEITNIEVEVLSGFERKVTPAPEATALPTPTSSASASPTPTATQLPTVSPGAFCAPAGATGRSASGVLYTCKTSPTDTRNRWRQ
jgi:hypothetical protein